MQSNKTQTQPSNDDACLRWLTKWRMLISIGGVAQRSDLIGPNHLPLKFGRKVNCTISVYYRSIKISYTGRYLGQ